MKKTEIKLIENKTEMYFRVLVNGKDAYGCFSYGGDPDEQTEARRIAKATAFDEICRAQNKGEKTSVSFLSY